MLVHSGVVRRHDCTVLLPGQSESGKSTLVAGLVRAGWDYLSDELALIDPTSYRLSPYQRPISIDVGAYHLFPELPHDHYPEEAEQWHVEAAHLRPNSAGASDTQVSYVVFNRFEDGSPTSLEPISAADCLYGLIANSIHLVNHGSQGFEVLSHLAEQSSAFQLRSGFLDEQVLAMNELSAI